MLTDSGPGRHMTAVAPVLFVLLWSTGFIGAKYGLPFAEPATFLALRFLLVAVLLLPIVLLTGSPWPGSFTSALHIIVVGLLVHGIYLGGIFAAIDKGVSAGDTALIVGLQPAMTAILIGPILGETVHGRQWMGFVLGTVGVVLVISPYLGGAHGNAGAIVLCVVGMLAMSVGTLYQKRFCANMDLRSGSFLQFTAAGLLMLLLALVFETRVIEWSGEFLFAFAWLVLALSLGAVTILWFLIRHGAAARVASLFFLVPPVTALIAWPLFGEMPSWQALVGMGLVVGGVLLVGQGSGSSFSPDRGS